MFQAIRQNLPFHPPRMVAGAFRIDHRTLHQIDPEGLRYVAYTWVWLHWCLGPLLFFMLVYRPYWGMEKYAAYSILFGTLMVFNGFVHYRLWSKKETTSRWVLGLLAMDVFSISTSAAISGGFSHYFFHLFYYPTLAMFAFTFSSLRLNLAWVTMVCLIYLGISLYVGDGLDLEARDEKPLLVRMVLMYFLVIGVNLVSRFERKRWIEAVDRERELRQEQVAFSRAVHDTAAQSAYMIGLGIDSAKRVAGDSNEELTEKLEAISLQSKSAIWQLRHPIDMGRIFEGRSLNSTLSSHVTTFTSITDVPAEVIREGVEPPLPVETRSLLFSIAHNALTNSFRHAQAGRVSIGLDFGEDEIILSVSDDGIGLPEGYEKRGHGFANMRAGAKRLGGCLVVEPKGPDGGASVTCLIPSDQSSKEG